MKLELMTMEQLVAEQQRLCDDPSNANPDKTSISLYNLKARIKLDKIARRIQFKIGENKIARGEVVNQAGYSGRQTNRRR